MFATPFWLFLWEIRRVTAAGCPSSDTILRSVASELCIIGVDKTVRLSYSLKFCHVPPPFVGVKEVSLFSWVETDSPQRSSTCYRNRLCCSYSQQTEGVLLPILPGSPKDRRFQTHFGFLHPNQMDGPAVLSSQTCRRWQKTCCCGPQDISCL